MSNHHNRNWRARAGAGSTPRALAAAGSPMPSKPLTVPQAAAALGLSEQRIRVLCAQGKLRARKRKLGRDWLVHSPIHRTPGKPGRPWGKVPAG